MELDMKNGLEITIRCSQAVDECLGHMPVRNLLQNIYDNCLSAVSVFILYSVLSRPLSILLAVF